MKINKLLLFLSVFIAGTSVYSQTTGDREPAPVPIDPNKNLGDGYDGYLEGECRNWVRNPSFELYDHNLNFPPCYSGLERANGWGDVSLVGGFRHAGTPDLYYVNQQSPHPSSACELCAVTAGDFAVEPVSTPPVWGNETQAYAGLGVSSNRPEMPILYKNDREYMIVALRAPLVPGVKYTISMKLSLGEVSVAAMPMQVYFTNSNVFTTLGDYASGINPNNGTAGLKTLPLVTSKNGWTTVTSEIIPPAGSAYIYMVIGNLRSNAASDAALVPVAATPAGGGFTGSMSWASYYLVDDVSVIPDCPAQVYLGGCNNLGYFDEDDTPSEPQNPQALSTLLSLIPSGTTSIYIDYPILVDVNYNLLYKDVTFGPAGSLIVPSGKKLVIGNSHLHGCYSMWSGIEVKPGGKIEVLNSTIEDANTAIWANNANLFSITNSVFDKNKRHVLIENHSVAGVRDIYGNSFTCTGTLKYPIPGETTSEAVTFKNCSQTMKFGTESSTLTGNTVTQADIGLKIMSTNALVYKNLFSDILTEYTDCWAIWADHTGGYGNYRSVTVGGPDANYRNRISNCQNGILFSGNHKAVAQNNYITNMVTTGIEAKNGLQGQVAATTQAQDADFMVLDNTIYNAPFGIRFYNNGNARIKAQKNTLAYTNGTGPAWSVGIYHGEKTTMPGGCRYWDAAPNFTREKLITENYMLRYGNGIMTDNSTCLWITKNQVSTQAPANAQHHGIWYRNSRYAFVSQNKVTGNRLGWQTIGIRGESTTNAECGCNTITKNGYAQVNAGWHTAGKIYTNAINQTEQGITVWGGGVGTQIPGYLGYNSWANVSPVGGQLRHFWAEATTQTGHSKFYLPLTTGSSQNPPAYSWGTYPIIPQSLSGLNEYDRGCLKAVPSWLNAKKSMEDELTEGIRAEQQGQVVHDVLGLLQTVDDNGWAGTSEIIDEYMAEHAAGLQPLVQAQNELSKGNHAVALSLLAAFEPANEYEELYKDWFTLLAGKALSGAGFDEADLPFLTETAQLCELEYGLPVFGARVLLANEFPLVGYEASDCALIRDENPGSLALDGEGEPEPDMYVLSPNPADVQIQVQNQTGSVALYSVRDNTGTELLSGTLNSGTTVINVSALVPGIYHVNYLDMLTGTVLETDLLLIAR